VTLRSDVHERLEIADGLGSWELRTVGLPDFRGQGSLGGTDLSLQRRCVPLRLPAGAGAVAPPPQGLHSSALSGLHCPIGHSLKGRDT